MQQQINYAMWGGLSLAIFLVLLFVSNIANKSEVKKLSARQSYDELALALDAAGILPGVDEGEMLTGFAALTLNKSKLLPTSPGSSLTPELKLGTVLSAKFQDGNATFIKLQPKDFRQLKHGELRQALENIYKIPYLKQQKEFGGIAVRSFTISVYARGNTYTISPGFNKQVCTSLVIN